MANLRKQDGQTGTKSTAAALIRAVPSGIFAAFASALLFTAVLLAGEDPGKLLGLFAYVALFVGASVCGAVSAAYDRSRGTVNSALGGTLYSLVMLAVSFVVSGCTGSGVDLVKALLVYALCIAISLLMGIVLRPRRTVAGEGRNNPAALARKRLGKG